MDSTKLGVPAEGSNSAEPVDSFGPAIRKKPRNPILMMILVLCLGLLVSVVYLGGRLSSAHASVASAKPAAFPDQKKASPAIPQAAIASGALAPAAVIDAAPKPTAPPAPIVAVQKSTPAPPAVVAAQKPMSTPTPATVAPKSTSAPTTAMVVSQKSSTSSTPAIVAVQKPASPTPPVIVAAQKPTPAPPPPVAKPITVAALAPLPKDPLPTTELAHPKSGNAYVQVGAFVSPYAERWVDVLEQRGFRPIVADGPNSVIHRVLLGPFGPSEVSAVEARLRQAGIDHFEKMY